jgi:hypothetical protein
MLFGYTYIKRSFWQASIMNFKELPEGIAGVIPIILFF